MIANAITGLGDKTIQFVQQFIQNQAVKTPYLVAVIMGNKQMDYQNLDRQSDVVASQIINQKTNSLFVAISTTRSPEMIVNVLAVLKAGKAYLPLDPAFPQNRLKQQIEDSGAEYFLSGDDEQAFFKNLGLKRVSADIQTPTEISVSEPGNLAYLLYTSGSTGTPKGVCMGHAALVNLINWQNKNSVCAAGSKTLQFAPLGFDVSFQEIFATFATGGTLVLAGDNERSDPGLLLKLIEEQQINRLFLPFVGLQYLTEAAVSSSVFPTSLREIMTAGEQLKITPQIRTFFKALPNCKLYNQYGPTECHVVTQLVLEGDVEMWPDLPSIGTVIDGVQVLILDENLQEMATGETGELCLAGACLADGYLHQPELTLTKFPTIFSPVKTALRIYRTGDLAKIQPNGHIDFLGRIDHQIKINGYRIEPGEIETLLNQSPTVKQAVVVAR
ncbi:MAG: amino acid adenylation domain-containing protein, partial [Sphingobacteriaceae bacterium]